MNMLDESWYEIIAIIKKKGGFTSDYSYDVSLGPVKKLAGALFDFAGRQMVKTKGKAGKRKFSWLSNTSFKCNSSTKSIKNCKIN